MHRFDYMFTSSAKKISSKKLLLVFASVIAYVFSYLVVGQNVLWKFVDSDQMIMADMALSFSKGIIPEPFFWGQNYLFPVESWLAVPFVWIGMRADLAILMPYPLLMIYFLQLSVRLILHKTTGNIALFSPLLLLFVPPKFFITEHLPRNFGTASVLAAIAVAHLLTTRSNTLRYISAFVVGAMIASFTASVLLLPLIGYTVSKLRSLAITLIALMLGYSSIAGMKLFYYLNPTYVGYQSADDSLSASRFLTSILSWDVVRTPLFTFVLPVSLVLFFFGRNLETKIFRRNLIIQFLVFCLIFGMFASEKILNYQESIYFSIDRFWVAVPFISILSLIGILFSSNSAETGTEPETQPRGFRFGEILRMPIMLTILCVTTLSLSSWVQVYAPQEVAKGTYTGVVKRSDLAARCRFLASLMPQRNSYLIVDARIDYFLIYGCRSISGVAVTGFNGDRRSWLQQQLINNGSLKVELSDLVLGNSCEISFCQ